MVLRFFPERTLPERTFAERIFPELLNKVDFPRKDIFQKDIFQKTHFTRIPISTEFYPNFEMHYTIDSLFYFHKNLQIDIGYKICLVFISTF